MGGVNLTIALGQSSFSGCAWNSVSTSFDTPILMSKSMRDWSVGHFFTEVTFPKTIFCNKRFPFKLENKGLNETYCADNQW